MRTSVAKRVLVPALTIALAAFAIAPTAGAQAPISSANAFGLCATQSDLTMKVAACTQASQATPFPWILHWVYRELARAQRDSGNAQQAIMSYARSLAAQEDASVRREMESLDPLPQQIAGASQE
jgi:hypothetical protein